MVSLWVRRLIVGALVSLLATGPAIAGQGASSCEFRQGVDERKEALESVTRSLRVLGADADSSVLHFILSQLASEVALRDLVSVAVDVDLGWEEERLVTLDVVISGPGIGQRNGIESSVAVQELFLVTDGNCARLSGCLVKGLQETRAFSKIRDLIRSGRARSLSVGHVEALAKEFVRRMKRQPVGEQSVRLDSAGEQVMFGFRDDEAEHARSTMGLVGDFIVAGRTELGNMVIRHGASSRLGDFTGSCVSR